jgi:MFS-type transporter involved in bile tolerance (Atg22 family)
MGIFPDANMGGDFGILRLFYMGVGSLGPTYVGLVAQRANYDLAFFGIIGVLLFGVVCLLRLR